MSTLTLLGCADAEQIPPPAPTPAASETSGGEHTVAFVGFVYDGVTGARLTDYTISYQIADAALPGTVDEEGRYKIGEQAAEDGSETLVHDISAFDDFTVIISADGYRAFRSHNENIGVPPELAMSDDIGEINTHQTMIFDAYVFPADLPAPAVTFTIVKEGVSEEPEGTIRLRATMPSLLEETEAGVPFQQWVNDEDLQSPAIVEDFADGQFSLDTGELLYGVSYQIDVYNVDGFQPLSVLFTAGVEGDKTLTLQEELTEPLMIISDTTNTCARPTDPNAPLASVVTIELNHAVEYYEDDLTKEEQEEALDNAFDITWPGNVLQPTGGSTTVQERGTLITVDGSSTIVLSWNPNVGLQTKDATMMSVDVMYQGLGSIEIQRVGSPTSATTLSALLGTGTITCNN